ncbi:hypothetical protein HanXRQr2_Chr15g0684271 [Helianthus annuus]|uniref:Uncharacterized protein n=1 Tax=Helianthus annuus TaxID=4232 RepID=A0A9K3DYE9_HELAN|nr:hypothetical protein HanXRQr2_Chr15g0684271 [Helianthus annuus]
MRGIGGERNYWLGLTRMPLNKLTHHFFAFLAKQTFYCISTQIR